MRKGLAAGQGSAEREASLARDAQECLSEEELLAFAGGTLSPSRRLVAHVHLDRCEICQRLLSEAAHALATAPPAEELDELSWHTTFQPGTLVGHRYAIVRFVARGGMGEVYEAFDRDLHERVALKTVTSTACDNASAVRRLKAEVQLARRVSHPNVCRIYDFGTHVIPTTGAQISFLTMQFVDGETLGQRVRLGGALPVAQAREFGRQLLRGLAAAHEAGVLHRDFKSDNVMLRGDGSGGCSPLILDFGLARGLEEGSRTGSASQPNLLGTVGYLAPEQLEGEPHSTASDIYAFGVVWFEMLTGERPFASASSPIETALARLQRSATAPSRKNPRVPSELDTVVLGCLRRSPKERFQTAGEVLDALETLEVRARRSFKKRRLIPLVIAAVLGAIGAYAAARPSSRAPLILRVATPTSRGSLPVPLETSAPERTKALLAPPNPARSAAVFAPSPKPTAQQSTGGLIAVRPRLASETRARAATPESNQPPQEPGRPALAAPRSSPLPLWENPFDAGMPSSAPTLAGGGS